MKDEILDKLFIILLISFALSCYLCIGNSFLYDLKLNATEFGLFSRIIAIIGGTLLGGIGGSVTYVFVRLFTSGGYNLFFGAVGAIATSVTIISKIFIWFN